MKKFVLHCDACGANILTNDGHSLKELPEVRLSAIPGGTPTFNQQLKKTELKKTYPRPKMFKCPRCGRGVVARKSFVVESKIEEKTQSDGREAGPT